MNEQIANVALKGTVYHIVCLTICVLHEHLFFINADLTARPIHFFQSSLNKPSIYLCHSCMQFPPAFLPAE